MVPTQLKGKGEEHIMWETLTEEIDTGTQKVIYEDKDHVHVHKYYKLENTEVFYSVIQKVTYRDGKIVHTQEEYEDLDYDPSEGQSWTWEDVRWWWEMITATEVTFEERQLTFFKSNLCGGNHLPPPPYIFPCPRLPLRWVIV